MSDEVSEQVPRALTKRARSYLLWYPVSWRERYGEEFVAHLEHELSEHPHLSKRTFDIALHGITARLAIVTIARRTMLVAGTLVLAVLVALSAVTVNRYYAPLQLRNGDGTGFASVGMPSYPKTINVLSFFFRSTTGTPLHITSVSVLHLPGYSAPKVVGVDIERHSGKIELGNLSDWPPKIPASARSVFDGYRLLPAIGRTVLLNRHDTLWVGFRTTKVHTVYVIEGLVVTYLRRGVSHTTVLSDGRFPDVICIVRQGGSLVKPWCSTQTNRVTDEARTLHPGARLSSIKSIEK